MDVVDAGVRILAERVRLDEPGENAARDADKLDRGAVARRRRHALVAGTRRAAHLVHPRAAVVAIAAEHEAGRGVHADLVVEALRAHVVVDARAGVALAEAQTAHVHAQRLLHNIAQLLHVNRRWVLRVVTDRIGRVVGGIEALHGALQDVHVVVELAVVADGLEPPPDGVARIVAGALALAKQVGYEAVAETRRVAQDQVACVHSAILEQKEACFGIKNQFNIR